MCEIMEFSSRERFRNWLGDNCLSSTGVWLLFGKAGGPKTVKASEALEEALCFGWIDGQMKSIDHKAYKKYFSLRREYSRWSEKNKALAEKLEKQGIMTDYGRMKIEETKKEWSVGCPEGSAGYTGTDHCFIGSIERSCLYKFSVNAFIRKENIYPGIS